MLCIFILAHMFDKVNCENLQIDSSIIVNSRYMLRYHLFDIYQNSRYADFVLINVTRRIAIEIDDETSCSKIHATSSEFHGDLLARYSLVGMCTAGQSDRCKFIQSPFQCVRYVEAGIKNCSPQCTKIVHCGLLLSLELTEYIRFLFMEISAKPESISLA